MTTSPPDNRERMRQLSAFIEQGLERTLQRKRQLGLADDAILDPEESIDQQVAILRSLFLEAERSALPFDSREGNFWNILRARLQPVVLAYLTHERFIQSLDKDQLALRPDVLTEVYRERLDNSDRFRKFFFELTEKLDVESRSVEQRAGTESQAVHLTQYKTADDTASIQGNVLKMLEKQLRDTEKEFNQQESLLNKANEEILYLKDTLHEKNDDVSRLRKQVAALEEELVHHKLSRDAANRSVHPASVDTGAAADAGGFVLEVDDDQLQERIISLEQELATASDAAYNAFMSSSDLGIVVLFMLSSFNCNTVEQLAQDMMRSVSTFGLKLLVGVRKGADFHYVGSKGADLQLQSVIEFHRGKEPVVEGKHLILFQPGCCILIQDAPKEDRGRYDRIKDHVGTLLKGAEARLEAIEAAQAVQRQKNQVEQLILRSYDVLQSFDKNVGKQQDKLARLMNLFAQELRKNLGIPPGDQKSIRLNMDLKKLEDSLKEFLKLQDLIDPAFVKNISKVAQGIQTKQKGEV